MQEIINDIASNLQALSDEEIKNLGSQSFYILNAYGEEDIENCFIYDAEIINIGEFLKNNFKIIKTSKEKLVLNKRGAILGFFRGKHIIKNKTYLLVVNYRSYLGNAINSKFQFTTIDEQKESVIIEAQKTQPIMVFEALFPKKDGQKLVLDENNNQVYDIKELGVMQKNEIETFKENFIKSLEENNILDEKIMYNIRFLTEQEINKLK